MYYAISSFLLVLVTIIISYFFYLSRHLRYWKRKGVNSPISGIWSFVSYMRCFVQTPCHETEMINHKKYGRIHGLFTGLTPQLVVAEPDLIKQILVKDFYKFYNRMSLKTGEPLFDNMLANLTNENWRRIRCIMSPTFSGSRMRTMAQLVKKCAENTIKHFENLAEKSEAIDLKRFFSNYVIDVIASGAFGTKLSSLEDPNNEFVTKAKRVFTLDTTLLSIILLLIPGTKWLSRINVDTDTFQYYRNFALHVIKERDETKCKGNDFLQLMIDAQKGTLEKIQDIREERQSEENVSLEVLPKHRTMSTEEMLSQCTFLLFAGSDTTAISIALLLYYMALNPDCQDKLVKEIDEAWEQYEKLSVDVFSQMPYLDAALNESFRLQPIGQLLRVCNEDCELGNTGIKITKGIHIAIPTYAMHHDPDFFPNPEEFDPERFMPENRKSISEYTFLPFGYGPRNCIGMRFVTMITKICILHIFKHLHVRATEETKKPLKYSCGQGLIQPMNIVVQFEKRQR